MLTTYLAFIGVALLATAIIHTVLSSTLPQKSSLKLSAISSLMLFIISFGLWAIVHTPAPNVPVSKQTQTIEELLEETQQHLTSSPNDPQAWFELGQLYMLQYEFDSASTCFDYAIRLSKTPYAGQFAALASALYYQHSQTITPNVQRLLDMTLEIDPFNETALQLIASDHFLSARYSQAITHWTMILDSNHLGVDRAKIIRHIQQAESFIR
ncbi:hypothetical protein VHA01S_008_00260 [Vibrio halioticoli NBRC 102217]|uniref:Cytochrome c-type biogenesis protein H TPR domain-containing protein n=1 Tax=Vibrio halioticoli NBRC 102217 TaxID=1219072 RepID=V5HGR3_9VIBR|nr:hypothetical protein [Vibrio halioticoli]GAD88630.1 hypothetical protein VHA01S_008_00260 [Vibrio halioticoli NBRC 102217]